MAFLQEEKGEIDMKILNFKATFGILQELTFRWTQN